MAIQTVFKRNEFKYLLTKEQKSALLSVMERYMSPDKYGRTTIRNLYFDTNDYLLIRRSIEKPIYKEKLRLRAYAQVSPDTPVFAELKKKYKHVVYKRRLVLPEREAIAWLCNKERPPTASQITREIDYVLSFYKTLHPTVFLCYDREAYRTRTLSDFRVTFDENVLCRQHDLSLCLGAYGTPILPEDRVLMEIKCGGGMPLWMTKALSELHAYKTSFSKYGTAYQMLVFPNTPYRGNKT